LGQSSDLPPTQPHELADCLCLAHGQHECQMATTSATVNDLTDEEAAFVRDAIEGISHRSPISDSQPYDPVRRVLDALYWDLNFRAVGYTPEARSVSREALIDRLAAATGVR